MMLFDDHKPTKVLVYINENPTKYYSQEVATLLLDEWNAKKVTEWLEEIGSEPLHHALDVEVPDFIRWWSYGPWGDERTVCVIRF